MAKTYNSIPTVSTGDVYTATAHNNIVENVNNYRVPPSVRAVRTSNLTGYTSGDPITWQAEEWDTDGTGASSMWDSGDPTKLYFRTAGLYLVVFKVYVAASGAFTNLNTGSALNALTSSTTTYVNGHGPGTGTAAFGIQSFIVPASAGDYMTFGAFFGGGSGYTVLGAASDAFNQSSITATWLGQVS
jgi:hypothetical protein